MKMMIMIMTDSEDEGNHNIEVVIMMVMMINDEYNMTNNDGDHIIPFAESCNNSM